MSEYIQRPAAEQAIKQSAHAIGLEIVKGVDGCLEFYDDLNKKRASLGYEIDGSGVKIGVLSNSYNSQGTADVDVRNGDLPGLGNIARSPDEHEWRFMLRAT